MGQALVMQSICRKNFRESSVRPFAAENLCRGACLIDTVVRLAPLELQVAAAEMVDDPSLRTAGEHAGNTYGAGARPAGQRFPAAAFPRSLADFARRDDLDELDIDPGREHRRMLDHRTQTKHQIIGGL